MRFSMSGIIFGLVLLVTSESFAQVGVTAQEILIGTSNVQTGPAANLGLELNAGSKAYIEKVNKAGGIHGRKIRWILEDDGYEPSNTSAKTNKLIETDKVFALFNYVGTPTSSAILPALALSDIPPVGLFTGAETLRTPLNKNVFNVRGSYWDEAEMMIANLVDKKKLTKIAIFLQDDGFGTAVQGGVVRALDKRGMKAVAQGRFQRNTMNVDAGLTEIAKSGAEAVVMVGTYKPLASFVKKARAQKFNPIFLTVSFVGTESYVSEVGADGNGNYITQVVPHPENSNSAIAKEYRTDLAAVGAKPSFGSFEGYLNALVLIEGLKAAGKDLNRNRFRAALESLNKDLGGFQVQLSKTNHQASKAIFLTKVDGGKVTEVPAID